MHLHHDFQYPTGASVRIGALSSTSVFLFFLHMRAGVPKDDKLGFDLRAWLFGANISPKTIIVGTSPA